MLASRVGRQLGRGLGWAGGVVRCVCREVFSVHQIIDLVEATLVVEIVELVEFGDIDAE